MDLNLLHLVFSLTIDGMVTDSFYLFDLSRRFPRAFREVTCGRTAPCDDCSETTGCRWFPLFGRQLSTNPEAVRRHQKPPLPFVFAPPLLAPGPRAAADLEIRLTLVGSAINHAGDFIRGVKRCYDDVGGGSKLLITLDGVSSRGVHDESSWVKTTKRGELTGEFRILAADDISGKPAGDNKELPLIFLTPFRQLREGRLLRTPDASAFLRGLIRRVSSLAAAYGEREPDGDFRLLAELSRDIKLTRNALFFVPATGSSRGGVQGSVSLSGNLTPFLPYLFLGEYLHAGKGASWGYGQYQLTIDN